MTRLTPFHRLQILGVFAALVVLAACSGPSTKSIARGAQVYEQQCAECHGKAGQGVEGKYADALYGDWPLPKLTHYIAQNMPEDKPESLTPADASAVSAYIYDSFYSRVAQARLHPARIELARMTNRQYLVSVADLVGRVSGEDERADAMPGLKAVYYNAVQRGRFDPAKLVHEGVDAELDFDFAPGTPVRERVGAAEFSMQWRGAVWADETGDYEFTVRTPNSFRFWINSELNPADAAIDANVSRPDNPDHRVTVRLIGGRHYPIGIDYWALPEKAGGPPPSLALRWKPPHGVERTIPGRVLSGMKVRPTFVVTAHFPADDSSQGYERGGAVSKAWDEATTRGAFEVANYVARKIDKLAGTSSSDEGRRQKIESFAEKFVATAFRRLLSAEEKNRYVTDQFKPAAELEGGVKRVVLLTLKSPHFLYTELPVPGQPQATMASRLAFTLWDSLPDAELIGAQTEGRLRKPEEVTRQANRMLADPRARAKLRVFFHHWLQMDFVEDVQKDATLYPEFTPEVMDDLRTSLNLFLDDVAWSDRSDFRELLRAEYLMLNPRLANFYGLPPPAAGDFARVSVPASQRSGVLTHPYLLSAFSYKSTSSPIHRGVFLTRNIVGRALKSPPMAVEFNDAEFAPDLSMREKVAKLTRSETCQGCHAVINPLGFSLEWYDAVGRYRTEENGRAIDAVSDYITDDNRTVRLTGARDVADFAIGNARANEAFIEQLFHYLVKQPLMAYGSDTSTRLRDSFIASGYNLKKLIVDITILSASRALESPPLAASVPPPRP